MAILQDSNDVLIDLNGELAFLQDDKLFVRDTGDTTLILATVTFNNSDLGVPDIDKLINFVDIDYEGAFSLTFTFDNVFTHTMIFDDKASRGTAWRSFPLIKRKGFKKLLMVIAAVVQDTKIYSIEIDFDILRRRRYN